ncbi:sigma-70 family RNA polymerase sigma factor [Paenibacillus sp. N1-5-1-14]|uniref:RNA polymerase sigma factor n=1 Tax=Paenibacillus radicibacter TaxID=2972488 RepID=UPI002158A284|nr:sigma-70 family RNA polymerase sigma factor [Paenibacillus radicibacter]MCR8645142.1 sigma-70 family RNA polymerase sigma factor [Paenibacillus radicibacter]
MDEHHLVKQILAGNQDAFRHLVDTYRTMIYQLAYSVLKHPGDAEDATQEIFVQIHRALPQYEYKGLRTWMSRIAINKAIDHRRKLLRAREQAIIHQEQLARAQDTSVFSPHTVVEQAIHVQETREYVHEQLQTVPDNYREVVVDYYFKEKSYQEIADEQGISTKTVESKLYRAKKWIRNRWKEEDFR